MHSYFNMRYCLFSLCRFNWLWLQGAGTNSTPSCFIVWCCLLVFRLKYPTTFLSYSKVRTHSLSRNGLGSRNLETKAMIWEVSPATPACPFSPTLVAQGCQEGPGADFLCPGAHSPPSPSPTEAGSMVFRTIGFVTLQEFGSRKFSVSLHCSNKVVASISSQRLLCLWEALASAG